ncbi:MAG: hypothetical protein IJF39_02330 [Clostridia bacterium]|nr:hypothetical protein [Clostridia bacterium]
MKRNLSPNNGKVYPFRHNSVSIVFCILALLLCAAGVGMSVYRIITEGVEDFTKVLQSPFLILICLFCATVIISILVKSEFIVAGGELITRFGFIKSRLNISTITSMEHDRGAHKLTVYCGEEYTVFTLKQEWEDDIVHEICSANKEIELSFTMTENKPPKDEGNKKDKSDKPDDKKDE